MLEILQHTPVWVYIVFVVLLYLSIRACFSHEVNTRQAIIFPLVFILLSILTFRYYPYPALTVPVWGAGALAGALLSRYLFPRSRFKLGERAHSLVVPGSYAILILLLLYFFLRYYLGYQEAVRGGVLQLTTTQLILFFCSSGFTTGFFIARAWLLRKYYVSLNHAST